MKCPFCYRERCYDEDVCPHCKFPFEQPFYSKYSSQDIQGNMFQVNGDQEVLDKLYSKNPEKRVVDFSNKVGWFRRILNGKVWD